MKYKIDVVRIRENSIQLNGWVIGKTPESKAEFEVLDQEKKPLPVKYVATRRDDVSQIYYKQVYDRDYGFDIQFPYQRGADYWLVIRCDGKTARVKYNEELIAKRASVAHKRMEKIKDLMNMETVHVALEFGKKHGLKALLLKSRHKLQGLDNDYDYGEWYELTRPKEEELAAQRETRFAKEPLLSIVIPAYKTPEKYLREMLDSILAQTYKKWEVCVANGSPKGEGAIVSRVMAEYTKKDSRFHVSELGENLGISGNTNAALEMASGDFIILADHDDTIPEHALYEVAKIINEHPDCDVIYSDEDKLDMDGGALFDPHFKPDFNPDLLTSVNYICHLFVVKRELLNKVGGFRHEFDGAQDYDFIFRCTENAKEICHIPKVLYHWRCHQESTASNPESKLYAFEAGARAIMAHYERMGIPAEKVEKGVDYGIYHTTFKIQGDPLVSVIIPNKDHSVDLDLCIRSIIERATYKNLEFIVVENNSTTPEIRDYYSQLLGLSGNDSYAERCKLHTVCGHDGGILHSEDGRISVVTYHGDFNYSAVNNLGVSYATGDYILLLNNDTEVITANWMEEMLMYAQREDVGAVGTKLYYADKTIQHAGVVIGLGAHRTAGHTHYRIPVQNLGYMGRLCYTQNATAVTGACLLVKKSLYEQVGGLDESFVISLNDVDFCLKLRKLGLLNVWTPFAELYHYESISRGLDDQGEKAERYNKESEHFREKWKAELEAGDPYYNPNFSLDRSDYALRDPVSGR